MERTAHLFQDFLFCRILPPLLKFFKSTTSYIRFYLLLCYNILNGIFNLKINIPYGIFILYRLEYFVKLKYTNKNIYRRIMYTEDYKFSERLKTLRKSKKLTQVQISELIGVQQGTYSRWENGTLEPGLEFVVKLANIFGTTTDYLLGQKPYSIISSLPLEQLDLTNIANFSKDEFDILKHSIAVSVARNKIKATELKDRVIEKNQLSEKDAELLNKIFEEVKTYWEN